MGGGGYWWVDMRLHFWSLAKNQNYRLLDFRLAVSWREKIVGSIGIGLPIRSYENLRIELRFIVMIRHFDSKIIVSGAFCGFICKSVLYNGSQFWPNPLTLDSAVCYAGCPWNRWKICEEGEKSLGPWSLRHSLQLWQTRFVLFWHFKMQVLRMQATWYMIRKLCCPIESPNQCKCLQQSQPSQFEPTSIHSSTVIHSMIQQQKEMAHQALLMEGLGVLGARCRGTRVNWATCLATPKWHTGVTTHGVTTILAKEPRLDFH